VTAARGAAASERFVVRAVNLDVSRWSGRRSDADVTAQAIAEAAGLPPLPPRREIINRNWAWVIMVAAAVCFGFGVYCGPLRTGNGGLPVALREAAPRCMSSGRPCLASRSASPVTIGASGQGSGAMPSPPPGPGS
jgi:hypothetical protein